MSEESVVGEQDGGCEELLRAAKRGVAERLRYIRHNHPEGPFTLEALAERAGVAQRTIAQLESPQGANVTLETLAKVAHSLGIRRIACFIDEEVFQQVEAELKMLAELRRGRVEGVSARKASPVGLPASSVKELTHLLSGILASAERARNTLQELPSSTGSTTDSAPTSDS